MNYKQRIMKQRKIIELYHKLFQNYLSGYMELFGDIDEYFDDDCLGDQIKRSVSNIDDCIKGYLIGNYGWTCSEGTYRWRISKNLYLKNDRILGEECYILYHRDTDQKICPIHISQLPVIIAFDKSRNTLG